LKLRGMKKRPTEAARSAIMRSVKGRNTTPEIVVRKFLHRRGFRFSLHAEKLPGKPDVVLSKHRTAIFVHGCFWHGHNCSRGSRIPKTNSDYWIRKISRNRLRDDNSVKALSALGYRVIVIWECQTRSEQLLSEILGDLIEFWATCPTRNFK
jgi:DNA mismatch endonuclease (patch repair protein)